jgi:hypothetical protein
MKPARILSISLGVIALGYVLFVVWFEAVYLGHYQPSFEEAGIPMLVIETTGPSGETNQRMLARLEIDNKIYVSAHHWPRGWYKQALQYPEVRVEIDGVTADYLAVPVGGAEFERVDEAVPLGFRTRFLMGFPPERDILRLDPVSAGNS